MALREQPYLPLYVQDFMSDEKLRECSAESVGVYIFLMCLMHKSDEYGKITLTEKYICLSKQSSKIQAGASTFALMLAKHLPFTSDVIERSLIELLREKVIQLEANSISQKRMVKDCKLSQTRALAGSKGGQKRVENQDNFAQAKIQANTDIEIEYVNEDEIIGNTITIPDYLKDTFKAFVDMRKQLKKPMSDRAKQILLNKLFKFSNDKEEQIQILEQSIEHSWTTIYELKKPKQKSEGIDFSGGYLHG